MWGAGVAADQPKKIFVGGLAYHINQVMLTSFMSQFGQVLDCNIIMDRGTGNSKGYGFVTFARAEDANNLIGNPNHVMEGRTLNIKEANPPKDNNSNSSQGQGQRFQSGGGGGGGDESKIFVGGVTDDHNEAALQQAFSQFGMVREVRIVRDNSTGRCKGFGFVTFDAPQSASAALQAATVSCQGVDLRINTPKR